MDLTELAIAALAAKDEYLAYKDEIKQYLDRLDELAAKKDQAHAEHLRAYYASQAASKLPKPMAIKSAINNVREICAEILVVTNPVGAISIKDPRTVAKYRLLIPDLRDTLESVLFVEKTLKGIL